jgi:hypothetical protein
MIILSIRRAILILIVLAGLTSCRNDLVVMAPYKDIPVVYCLLNPKDSVNYLRLEKSFLGADNAYEMAQRPDSIYYKDAIVVMERWADGQKKESATLDFTTNPARDSGIFTHDPNYLYRLSTPVSENSEYRLSITVPSTGAEVSAVTWTVTDFKVIKPESYKKNLAFSSYDNYQTVEWITAPHTRIYHLVVRFHYLECSIATR